MYAHWLWLAMISGPNEARVFAERSDSINECASFSQKEQARGLQLTLQNGCGSQLRCEFSWTVVCHKKSAHEATRERRRFTLAPGHSHGVSVVPKCDGCRSDDAKRVCDEWEIDNVQWSCTTR
jgi:hypothetical protein